MPNPRALKVLVVEDERDLADPLVLRLNKDGRFAAEAVYDGREGLRKAIASPPDAALVDLDLPELDGWELCRRLRSGARTRRTRVVLMTAWAGRDLMKRAAAEGVARVLLKPFDTRDLLEAVDGGAAVAEPRAPSPEEAS